MNVPAAPTNRRTVPQEPGLNESREVDVLIAGAGPAGLAAGISAAREATKTVRVVEKNARPGCKLRLSGSGQCNLTHAGSVEEFFEHYGDRQRGRFAKPALAAFDNRATSQFFCRRGLPLLVREDGKIFPQTLRSDDVLRVLLAELEEQGGQLQTETRIQHVEPDRDGFLVQTDRGRFQAGKLILATGGRSYPATGSTGDGFRIAESLGHRIEPPRPALAPIVVRDYALAGCAGISFRDAGIELLRNGRRIRSGRGDVLLTHRGLSGPGILDLSRFIEPDDAVHVALCRDANLQDRLSGKKTLKNALMPLGIPERLLTRLLEALGISSDRPAAETDRTTRRRLESALAGYPFAVERLGGWDEAMTTRGGVALDEVDRRTLESRRVPGLFFCGEVLDIDGDCGGYNIQFALSSGFLAGRNRSI